MSEEAVTTSWFSRLGSAFKGVVIGIVLVLVAMYILWWNEGRSVRRYKEINYAKDNVVEANLDAVDASKEGKLIHFAGPAKTADVLKDENYGIQVKDSYSMTSTIEMYQWKETEHRETGKTKKNLGGSTTKEPDKVTYTYERVWSSSLIPSDSFKVKVEPQTKIAMQNPTAMPAYKPVDVKATNVTVGAYTLPADQAGSLGTAQILPVDYEQVKDVLPKTAVVDNGVIYFNVYGEEQFVKDSATVVPAAVEQVAPVSAEQTPAPAANQPVPEAQTAVQNAVDNAQAQAQTAVQNAVNNAQTAVQNAVSNAQTQAQTAVQNAVDNAQAQAQTAVENAAQVAENVQTTVENTAVVAGGVNVAQYRANPALPKVGDVRITYKHSPVADVTVIAKQTGNTVERLKIDSELSYMDIRNGKMEAKDVFAANEKAEGIMVWVWRIAGFFLMSIAFNMIFAPLSVLADVIPFFGNIAEAGCGIISKILAFGLSVLVIAIAWLRFRPMLAIGLFILMGAAAYGIFTLISKAKAAKAAKAAPAAAEPAPAENNA